MRSTSHPLAAEELLYRFAFDELHHDEVGVVLVAAVNDADDVGMVQAGQNRRLALEAVDEDLLLHEFLRQHLNGHAAVEGQLRSLEDHRHAARAQQRLDDIVAQPLSGAETGGDLLGHASHVFVNGRRRDLRLAVGARQARGARLRGDLELPLAGGTFNVSHRISHKVLRKEYMVPTPSPASPPLLVNYGKHHGACQGRICVRSAGMQSWREIML